MQCFDVIVIGAGVNGLAAAGRLAKAGRNVALLEASSSIGGAAVTEEFAPGFRVSRVAHILNTLDPRVVEGMDLERHGLRYAASHLASTSLSENGRHLVMEGVAGERLLGDVSNTDRVAWQELRSMLLDFAGVLRPFKSMTPPRLAAGAGNELVRLAALALKARGLGRARFREFLRMILINIADVLEDELGDDRLKGAVAFDAVLGSWLGPRSPNSLILYLNRLASEAAGTTASLALPHGGMGGVTEAMANAALASGVTVFPNSRVRRIMIEDDRAAGILLESGERLCARQVLSAINPKTTFQKLVGPHHLDTGFLRKVEAIRMRGGAAKLHLALSGAPDFRGADLRSRLVMAPSIRAVEDAFNAVKYGDVPDRPVMEAILPSVFDAGFAPQGCHVLSAIVQFAPHAPREGVKSARDRLLANTLAVLERYAPRINTLVAHAELLMPSDLEERYGMVGGNWHHGELAVERMLFLRPVIGAAQYSTPITGLWLAGAGSHPGGGVSGAAGWNAAERLLAKEERR